MRLNLEGICLKFPSQTSGRQTPAQSQAPLFLVAPPLSAGPKGFQSELEYSGIKGRNILMIFHSLKFMLLKGTPKHKKLVKLG